MNERIPPQAIEEEMAVLGCVLLNDKALLEIQGLLKVDFFYKKNHQIIYQAMLNLQNKNIDYLTLCDELTRMDKLDEVGGAYYLTQLTQRITSSANVKTYANIVANKALLREIIDVGVELEQMGYSENIEPHEIIEKSQQKILSLTMNSHKKYSLWNEVMLRSMDMLSEFHQKKGVIGIPTGLRDLDNKIGGLKNGKLIILAGRPSMGKTGFAINNIALNAAKMKISTGIFSLEMEDVSLAMRSIASEANVDHHKMVHGYLQDQEWQKISAKISKIYEIPIFIDDTPGLNILNINSKARQMKAEHDIGLLIIDYLQLISSHQRCESRDVEVGNLSRSAKSLARELDLPVILLCQLNRQCEQRANKKPILSDLRESGNIEQDADLVLFIYRPEIYGISGNDEIIIAKNRNGPVGSIGVKFFKEQIVFKNLDNIYSNDENIYDGEENLF